MQVYADNAATTKLSKTALEAMLPYFDNIYGNPSSLHSVGQEAKEALETFAEIFLDFMYSIDYQNNYHFNDIHCLFGTTCCLAELQSALPGKIITSKPLRLVLDRRPFI